MRANELLEPSCRVALAAYLHDMGKFAERARIEAAMQKDADGNTRADIKQRELDAWFLEHGFGQSGIGLAALPASCDDFRHGGNGDSSSKNLMRRLFESLEEAKLRRFDLCGAAPPGQTLDAVLFGCDCRAVRAHDDEDLLADIYPGIKLVEYTGLGGSGSRGYGKLRFQGLTLDGEPVQDAYERLSLAHVA